MDRITIRTKQLGKLETIFLVMSVIGLFLSAVLSNYMANASKYTFFASLLLLLVFMIKKISKPYKETPLIQQDEETIKVFKYKNRPFLGLTLSEPIDIKWNNIERFSAANFSGLLSLDSIWYCFEDKNRNVVENFIGTEHINQITLLIDLVKTKLDAEKINLEGMK